jgi:REP element-mobilizing transposase RayT
MADTDKFKGKYRISSARWAAWDYSSNAAYFVTICVANRAHDFGEIVNGRMNLSPLGQSAQDCWNEIPVHFPFVELDEFVVMPNHIHGVVVINKPVETHNHASPSEVPTQNIEVQNIETQYFASLPRNKFGPQSQNLASIIRGYKIGVTKFARQNGIPFAWQARYHDRVIRNAEEHENISAYIQSNPQNWEEDEFFKS